MSELDDFLETRVFDIREFDIRGLDELAGGLAPATAWLRDGLVIVALPTESDGKLSVELTGWMDGDPVGGSVEMVLDRTVGWEIRSADPTTTHLIVTDDDDSLS